MLLGARVNGHCESETRERERRCSLWDMLYLELGNDVWVFVIEPDLATEAIGKDKGRVLLQLRTSAVLGWRERSAHSPSRGTLPVARARRLFAFALCAASSL